MDIGTAKPTVQERLRAPHHLIDVADPDDTWSLAIFQREANKAIQKIQENHHLPFLVGGTGQFIRAIIEGWKIPSGKPDYRLREVLTQWSKDLGTYALHSKLSILDPVAASSIDPSNVRRTIRALEVIFATGRLFSDQKESGYRLYNPLLIGFTRPRGELYQRIDTRITKMIECGLVNEVQSLLDRGYSPDLPTMSAIGYREIVSYLHGKITLEDAVILMKRRTREFVRRQVNWFKPNDPNIHWYQADGNTLELVENLIANWIASKQNI